VVGAPIQEGAQGDPLAPLEGHEGETLVLPDFEDGHQARVLDLGEAAQALRQLLSQQRVAP
jgi:hypothetical protein